mgnify:CR=1 FL=1
MSYVDGLIDIAQEKESLGKEKSHRESFLANIDKKLSNEKFMQNADPEIVFKEKQKQNDAENKLEKLKEKLALLG